MSANVCIPAAERPPHGGWKRPFDRATEVVRFRPGQQVQSRLTESVAVEDCELFWFFGFDWGRYAPPKMDSEGRLSPWQISKLLEDLKLRERVFEFNLAELRPDEQEHLRRRYLSVQKFFKQAIEDKTPIYARA